ncbi:MAG: DinB family protein [Pyrinomonadaceae bacterium]
MRFNSIDEVFDFNDEVRNALFETIENLDSKSKEIRTDDGKWTVKAIVEHLALVDKGGTKIIEKLVLSSPESCENSAVRVSRKFIEALSGAPQTKFVAPEIVEPTNNMEIYDSLNFLKSSRANLNLLRDKIKFVDVAEKTFPHPIFGRLNAHDWLILLGFHESRHLNQIKRVIALSK